MNSWNDLKINFDHGLKIINSQNKEVQNGMIQQRCRNGTDEAGIVHWKVDNDL